MLDQSPRFDADAAERVARERFGLAGRATALPSERDQNFLIAGADGGRIVLKIANAAEDRAMLAAQQQALGHLVEPDCAHAARRHVPPTASTLVDVDAPDGKRHLVWAVTWVPGRPLGAAARRSPALLGDLGRQVARLGAGARRLRQPGHPPRLLLGSGQRPRDRRSASRRRHRQRDAAGDGPLIGEFDSASRRCSPACRASAIHGDLNDHNVLVGGWEDVESRDQRVTGIVDFGDMVHSYRVGDLAIAIAYAMLGADDPLDRRVGDGRAAMPSHATLGDDELAALFGLAALRLCASVCIAADQQQRQPDNEYLGVSQSAIGAAPARARGDSVRSGRSDDARCGGRVERSGRGSRVGGFSRRRTRSHRCSASICGSSRRSCST